jgi:Uma2 family endonuclease
MIPLIGGVKELADHAQIVRRVRHRVSRKRGLVFGNVVLERADMSTQPKTFLTPEQYLEIERKAEYKSEYYEGEMFAMAGAREAHNLVAGNLYASAHRQLRGHPCRTYSNDMRVRVSASGLYTYPDVVVVCDEPRFLDEQRDTLLNPTLVVEVLSPTTEAYDRGRKFEHYRSLESLKEYLLIASARVGAELFARQPSGQWLLTAATRPENAIELQSGACRIALADIYEKVEFA